MSEITFECPYCEWEQFEEIEGMNEFDNRETECKDCHKKFTYRVAYSVEGYTDKIDEALQ